MRICLAVPKLGSIDINNPGNVQGDEMIARAWAKYLPDHEVILSQGPNSDCDIIIHFNPHLGKVPGKKNILYLQNAYEPENYEGGTVGIFSRDGVGYDGYLFTSEKLRSNCVTATIGRDGFEKLFTNDVIPFAVDEELFYKRDVDPRYAHQVCFVGNNLRGREKDAQYMVPIRDHLVLYGNPDSVNPELVKCHRGKLPIGDEPVLYSSSSICLNVHIAEHAVHDTVNFRVYTALACGGFIISDIIPTLEKEFTEAVFLTPGGSKLADAVQHFLCNPSATESFRKTGKDMVLSQHTFRHRMQVLSGFLDNL